jgi:hypothetical protein
MVIFHPLVKVIIFPNLLFCYAAAQLTNWTTRDGDPGKTHWSQK